MTWRWHYIVSGEWSNGTKACEFFWTLGISGNADEKYKKVRVYTADPNPSSGNSNFDGRTGHYWYSEDRVGSSMAVIIFPVIDIVNGFWFDPGRSGKTAAFLWPMLIHIADQRLLQPGDGPIGLILCPTRELALQIYTEAKKFGKVFNFNVCCCYGGGSKWEQSKDLEAGAEIVVATPGRMIDLIKMKATNLARVTYLVLDECDRMFDMGFSPQVHSICAHVRPDRQTLLFSATFRKKVEKLARVALSDPIRVVQVWNESCRCSLI